MPALAFAENVDESLMVDAERHRRRRSGTGN
jgi:hypothetical protein